LDKKFGGLNMRVIKKNLPEGVKSKFGAVHGVNKVNKVNYNKTTITKNK
jgi:hypothetical protein